MDVEKNLKIIDVTEDTKWDVLMSNRSGYTIFHSSLWASVIKATYAFTPKYILCDNDDRDEIWGWPFFLINEKLKGRRLVCLPFTDSCSPILPCSGIIKNASALFNLLTRSLGAKSIELRSNLGLPGFIVHNYYKNYILKLNRNEEVIWKLLKPKSVRYLINKAARNGIKVSFENDKKAMMFFIKLNKITRTRHGVLPQPSKFFYNVWENVIDKGHGFILLAYLGKKIIASSIVLYDHKSMYHKYNASCNQFANYGANHIIIWRAIQWALKHNLAQFDFGRTSPENTGLNLFKKHWGTVEEDLNYYYWPGRASITSVRESDLRYRIASSIIMQLPLPVSSRLGDVFYRYFG